MRFRHLSLVCLSQGETYFPGATSYPTVMQQTCHPTLLIIELLPEIFHLVHRTDGPLRRRTLAAGAATGRRWRDALDVLWEEADVHFLLPMLSDAVSGDSDSKPVSYGSASKGAKKEELISNCFCLIRSRRRTKPS